MHGRPPLDVDNTTSACDTLMDHHSESSSIIKIQRRTWCGSTMWKFCNFGLCNVGFECLIEYIVLDLSIRTCVECRKLVAYKLKEKYEG